jgi:hypothetical protein
MHSQVPLLFESYIGKKINWNKVWLFTEPSSTFQPLKLLFSNKEKVYVYDLECYIKTNDNKVDVCINIRWEAKNDNPQKFISTDVSKLALHFQIKSNYPYTQNDFDKFPSYTPNEKPKILKYNLYFPVETFCESIPHEAILSVKFKNGDDKINEVQTSFGTSQNEWNKELFFVPNLEEIENNRGLIHNIYFDRKDDEDGRYKWYLDHGSAKGDVVKFLLERLAKDNINIANVEIENI